MEKSKHDHHASEKGHGAFRGFRFLLKVAIVLGLPGIGLHMLFLSSYFHVKTIRWEGVHRVDPRIFQDDFKRVMGTSLIYLNVDHLHAEIVTHPWVKEAIVRKVLPNRIDVLITERTPVAVEQDPKSGKTILRDDEGRILEEGDVPMELPRITHYSADAYQTAAKLLPLLSTRKDAVIDLSSVNDIQVAFARSGGILHFGDRNYDERWKRFTAVEADLNRFASWEADLRFPAKVVVKKLSD